MLSEGRQSFVVLQHKVHLVEFLEGITVVLTRTLRENIHAEVSLLNFFLVLRVVVLSETFALPLELLVSLLQLFLLVFEASLNDLGTSEQTFLK